MIAFLWFAMVEVGWEIVASVAAVPREMGPIVAMTAAAGIVLAVMREQRRLAPPVSGLRRRMVVP